MFEDYMNIGINGETENTPDANINAISVKLCIDEDKELSIPLKPHFYVNKRKSVSIISELENKSVIHDNKTGEDREILTERALRTSKIVGIKELGLITNGKQNNMTLEKAIIKIRNVFDGDEDMKNIPCEDCSNIEIIHVDEN